ncbi:hypothetical protein CCUS01_04908 [Colletotrichum cuscutae]|uniref:Uncharacterized protein n=1 Tax=Colletotrichum cuscutae TaxID=1209917 RepID=A0AAI9VD49_9PEZI|nr:hypothetical protein CCUS01_04908 [Colletotrichum cuscutae]
MDDYLNESLAQLSFLYATIDGIGSYHGVTELRVAFQVIRRLLILEKSSTSSTQLIHNVLTAPKKPIQKSLLHDAAPGRAHNEKG